MRLLFIVGFVCLASFCGFCGEVDKEYENLADQLENRVSVDRFERLERETLRREALILPGDRDPLDVVLRRTKALLDDLGLMEGGPDLRKEAKELSSLLKLSQTVAVGDARRKDYFSIVCGLRRKIAFSNPLLDFDNLVFAKRQVLKLRESSGSHMCDQYFGFLRDRRWWYFCSF